MTTRTVAIGGPPRTVAIGGAARSLTLVDAPALDPTTYEEHTLTVDTLPRVLALRSTDLAGPVADCVIWLPGGGQNGPGFLGHVGAAVAGRLDVGLTGQDTFVDETGTPTGVARTNWVKPGQPPTDPFYPPGAPSDATDIHLIEQTVDYVQARYGAGVRFWLGGFSMGAGLGWSALCWNQTYDLGMIRAYFLGSFGAPLASFYGWSPESRSGLYTRKPLAIWHGGEVEDSHSRDYGGADTWDGTAATALAICGQSAFSTTSTIADCCGTGHDLTLRTVSGGGGAVAVRDHARAAGGHVWLDCPGCREASYALAWFATFGLGT